MIKSFVNVLYFKFGNVFISRRIFLAKYIPIFPLYVNATVSLYRVDNEYCKFEKRKDSPLRRVKFDVAACYY